MTIAHRRRNAPLQRIRRLVLIGVAAGLVMTGCSDEGRQDNADAVSSARSNFDGGGNATEAPATDAPEPTQPPATEAPATTDAPVSEAAATEAATTEASATEAPEDGSDVGDWLPVVLIALAVLLLVWWLVSAMRRASDRRRAGKSAVSGRLGQLVGTGRWVHDQGVPEIQRTNDPAQLQQFWQATRQRMIAMEEEATAMLLDADGDSLANALKQVNNGSQALRSAVDGDVAMRAQTEVDPDLVADSARTVSDRRREFNHALDRVADFR